MNRKIQEIDLRGFRCPIPVLKISKLIKGVNKNQILKVKVDDPKAENDIEELAKNINIKIIKKKKCRGEKPFFLFSLKKC